MAAVALSARVTRSTWQRVPGATRRIRTGFFTDDPDFLDPEAPLLAQRVDSRWRYMDDASLSAPVLSRSNVGMGMLVLNRARGLDLRTVNMAYSRLRDLEVNTLLRVVGFTAMEPGPFCLGLDLRELLLAATTAQRTGGMARFSRALLWHYQELAHLMADFRKPLVVHISGAARNGGVGLGCLPNFSGAYTDSEIVVDACRHGLVPDGGTTFVLAGLKWNLGAYLALTGRPLRGADLVYADLVEHWLSPDALPFLELTSEKQLHVSESDAGELLKEHSLRVPDGLGSTDSLPAEAIPLVAEAFSGNDVARIVRKLREIQKRESQKRKKGGEKTFAESFVEECLEGMSKASPMALQTTLSIIRKLQDDMPQGKPPRGSIGQHGENGLLVQALRLELRAQLDLLHTQDAVLGLHAACMGRQMEKVLWSASIDDPDLKDRVDQKMILEDSADSCEAREWAQREKKRPPLVDFTVATRAEVTLSAHPRLRRYHPDYDPATGLDHDPAWMAAEVQRWSPDFFQEERDEEIKALLGKADGSSYGLSRFVQAGRP